MPKRPIRSSTLGLLVVAFAAVLGPAAAGAAPLGPGPADQAAPQATLVRTHVFLPGRDAARTGGGKPQPSTANCSADGTSQGDATFTGFKTTGGFAQLNLATAPGSVRSGAEQAIKNAFGAWTTGHPAPSFTVALASTATKETPNRHTDVLFGRTPGNAIAVTYTWRWSDTQEYESDTVFSNRVAWAIVPETGDGCNENVVAYDLQNIATHEFGHIYGLDHPTGDRFATMYAYGYTGETLKRTLAPSDSAGIDTVYTSP